MEEQNNFLQGLYRFLIPRRNRVPKNMEREDNFLGVPRFGFVGTSIENWDPDLQIDFEKIKKK